MKTSNTTTYTYDTKEIINLIKKDLCIPQEAISFTFSQDGTYNIIVDNDMTKSKEPEKDPYDAYKDQYGNLPRSMW